MKAFLIDPAKQAISWVEISGELAELYALIGNGCDGIDAAFPFGTQIGEVFYVDDYGALKEPRLPFFMVSGYRWPIYGRAVVLGFNAGGKETSSRLSFDQLEAVIRFA